MKPAKTFKAWTDYPITELGDMPCTKAPIRECTIIDFDRDKYCHVIINGITEHIKYGYLYKKPGRAGEARTFPYNLLCKLPKPKVTE